MTADAYTDAATARVIVTIFDEDLAASYPNRAHFIAAEHPDQEEMTSQALSEGDPVAIVYADGDELLIYPEDAGRCHE